MDDTAKDVIILTVLAESAGTLTARQIALRTVQYQTPVRERDVNTRLQHLMARSYVIQGLRNPQEWAVTAEGIKWAAQNRRK